MSKLFYLSILLALATAVIADIDYGCLGCICQVESNCQPLDCHLDPDTFSCGYYQFKETYWMDCGSPDGSLEACGKDKACSDKCVQAYMARYGTYCTGGRTPTCEDYARIHNGGPTGCNDPNTLSYWSRVQACYYG